MSKKADFYDVLGVSKSATPEEIAKAHRRGVMQNHPDRLRNATDAEKKAAEDKLQAVTEAHDVLSDPHKRRIYDQHGHEGIANLGKGNTGSAPPSFTPGQHQRRPISVGEAFDYFERSPTPSSSGPSSSGPVDRAEAARRREAARLAKRDGAPTPFTSGMPQKPFSADKPVIHDVPPSVAPEKQAPAAKPITPEASRPAPSFGDASSDKRMSAIETRLAALEEFCDKIARSIADDTDGPSAASKPPGFDR